MTTIKNLIRGPWLLVLAGILHPGRIHGSDLKLWYDRPAARWLEALPAGNGRLGAMVFGGVAREQIALNESTVWSGAPSQRHDNPAAREHLAEIRQLMFAGEYIKARDLCARYMLGRPDTYGTHLPMASLWLDFPAGEKGFQDYRRWLDLDEAITQTDYSLGGALFHREVLVSHPAQVVVIRLTCDQPGRIGFKARLDGGALPHAVRVVDPRTLALSGRAVEKKHSDGKTGVAFETFLRVLPSGGQVRAGTNTLEVEAADAVTLVVAAGTTFRELDPAALCQRQLERAAGTAYAELREAHLADHRRLFRRVQLELGSGTVSEPTDRRLAGLRKGQADPQLAALFFQYGRYLLIAGSREDSPLPTNLQGIWNDNLACNSGWTCDFHLDINTQQNYWPAEVANLSECHEPLFRLIEALREPGRRTARTVYGVGGWVCHVFTNPWGYTAPGWGLGWGIHPTGGIWLASHLWQRWQFTGDREFLAGRAYPVLKEAAEFFLDYLVEHPRHGWLVSGPSTSPENAFLTPDGQACSEYMGPTCDRVLIYDLFTSCIEASRVLGRDADFRARVEAARARLSPLKIGRHGQLQEWLEDFEEAVPNHRHTTHLIALFPSDQITPRGTPDLAQAARVTLERRLSRPDWEDVEWSRGNLINFYARLGDGTQAHKHLLGLLGEDTDSNLLTFSRGGIAGAPQNIFCVDGNSAGASGVAEMLLQSHGGEITLLPALPAEWPRGKVAGLRARGGFEVGLAWQDGQLRSAAIRSLNGAPGRVRWGERTYELRLQAGGHIQLEPGPGNTFLEPSAKP